MDRLSTYTKKISREIEMRDALSTVEKFWFDKKKPIRMIEGIAISSREPNENKNSMIADGASFSLPLPLLWNHQWEYPLGRVVAIERRSDQLRFKAEIGNSSPFWGDQIWNHIIARSVEMVSIEAINRAEPACGPTFSNWQLTEISVVESGADHGAFITKCLERLPFISLVKPQETIRWEFK